MKQRRLVAHPHDAAVARDHAIFFVKRFGFLFQFVRRAKHARAVFGMQYFLPKGWVFQPLFLCITEEIFDLRTHILCEAYIVDRIRIHHHRQLFDQSSISCFRRAKIFSRLFTLHGKRYLYRDELQNIQIALTVSYSLRIGLNRHNADGFIFDLKRHAKPINRTCAGSFKLSILLQLLHGFRFSEERRSISKHIRGQSISQRGCARGNVVLIYKIGESK